MAASIKLQTQKRVVGVKNRIIQETALSIQQNKNVLGLVLQECCLVGVCIRTMHQVSGSFDRSFLFPFLVWSINVCIVRVFYNLVRCFVVLKICEDDAQCVRPNLKS